MKKIIIASEHKNTLSTEFGVSLQTVRMSLQGVFQSDKSKKIRSRAKELLLKDAEGIEEVEVENTEEKVNEQKTA